MNPLTPYLAYIKWGLILLVCAGLFAWGDHHGAGRVQAKYDAHLLHDAQQSLLATQQARQHEQRDAANSAKVAQAYEQGKRDAEAAGKRVADGLRAGTLKLRKQWQGCQERLSNPAAGATEPDATATDRNESAGRIVRAAREADEQIKGLQRILRAERDQ
jgi:hypothetical protein